MGVLALAVLGREFAQEAPPLGASGAVLADPLLAESMSFAFRSFLAIP